VDLFGQLGDAGLEPQDFLLGLGDVAKQIGDKRLQHLAFPREPAGAGAAAA
jgi:hypothetical protein